MGDLLRMAPSPCSAELIPQTACLRPLPRDGLPIVGKVPGWLNLFLYQYQSETRRVGIAFQVNPTLALV